MKKFCFVVATFLFLQVSASEGRDVKNLTYQWDGDMTAPVTVALVDLPDGRRSLALRMVTDGVTVIDEQIIGKDDRVRHFNRKGSEGTDYSVEYKEHALYLSGTFEGKTVDTKIPLDGKAYYGIPWINLSAFAVSPKNNIRFWMLRDRDLAKVMMQARKRGEASLTVNGHTYATVRINFSVMNLRERYNKGVYYYRKSDGIMVKGIFPDGSVLTLAREE